MEFRLSNNGESYTVTDYEGDATDIYIPSVYAGKNVIGIECFEGTEKLIERCSELKYKHGEKPILVKLKKVKIHKNFLLYF